MSGDSWVLVDSSAWIFALRRDGIEHIRKRIDHWLDQDRLAICGLVMCELLGGAKNPKEYDRLERDLEAPHELALDNEVWKAAAKINFTMAQAGKSVPTVDCAIAATAMRHKAILAHCDEHLDRIAKVMHLRVESYVHLVRRIKGGG